MALDHVFPVQWYKLKMNVAVQNAIDRTSRDTMTPGKDCWCTLPSREAWYSFSFHFQVPFLSTPYLPAQNIPRPIVAPILFLSFGHLEF